MEYNDIKLSITLQEDMMSHKRNAKLLSESRVAQVCFVLDVGRRWPYWQQQQQRWPADVRTFLCLPSHRPPARGGIGEIGLTAVKCGILTQLANIEYLHCTSPPPCVHTVLDPSLTKIYLQRFRALMLVTDNTDIHLYRAPCPIAC